MTSTRSLRIAARTTVVLTPLLVAGGLWLAWPAAQQHPGVDAGITTGSIPGPAAQAPAPAKDDARLRAGLAALAAGDLAGARAAVAALPEHDLDRRLLMWAIATDSNPAVTSAEISDTARALGDWPGVAALQKNAELALLRERPAPDAVIAFFADGAPQTTAGTRALARAHVAAGDEAAARKLVSSLWRTAKLTAVEEAAVLKEFASLLSTADHRHRLEAMLYDENAAAAQRVAKPAEAEALAKAWIAVNAGDRAAPKLLDAVPEAQRAAAYIFAMARYLRRAGRYAEAGKTMLTAPTAAAELVDPDAWWIERRVLSRELLDIGDTRAAYEIAAAHAAESPANQADAEFHAGWYALRFLNEPKLASGHFAKIAAIAEGPISLARAHYWLGRAAEAAGDPAATARFQRAASYGTAFYGQVAAARLGRGGIAIGTPDASAEDRTAFEARDAVRALHRLEALGDATRADRLYRDLAQSLVSPGEIALLVGMAERRGDHYLALRLGKLAAARGLATGALAWPTGAIPADAGVSGAGKALAYAIARQESEFKATAVSRAGALGLLQLMPGTAKEMAAKANLPFAVHKLTNDAGYNATLGATFLSEQLDRFSGSYVLTFAGYNAGPRRARDWIDRYGDPRQMDVDGVIDWIERIPFTETRHYVQRIMENYQIYKMRLTGRFSIASDLTEGRRS